MSKLLESLKTDITKSRSLAYFGKYSEAVVEFSKVIDRLQAELSGIPDRTLLSEWNRLIDEIKSEREQAQLLRDALLGNFQAQSQRPSRPEHAKEAPEKEGRPHKQVLGWEDPSQRVIPSRSGRRQAAHEDDELYNRREKEQREKEKAQVQKDERDRERLYEEREAEIWPKKKPVAPANKKASKTPNEVKVAANNSGLGRQYKRPWLENAKKKNENKSEGEQKKSFLKHVYPEGAGPDTNLIEMLEKQVVTFNPDVTFEDIAELQKAKDVLTQAVLLPLMMPHLFTGIRRAWKGVLLFGPPGTGKTLLAKAIASGGKTTFFNVTASSLASKWKGESEKLVRLLFQMAKFYAPTTIFIDEIDSLASMRGEREDESSRKVKTELMTRIDGVSSGEEGRMIVVIGATNRPWDLDEAIRRRLQKRIYIPLPTEIGRRELLRINLKTVQTEGVQLEEIVSKTDGYSGADIALLCRQAAYMPMRRNIKKAGGLGNKLTDMKWLSQFEKQVTVPLTMEDFNQAIRNVKPSVGKGDLAKYQQWMTEFGQQGTN